MRKNRWILRNCSPRFYTSLPKFSLSSEIIIKSHQKYAIELDWGFQTVIWCSRYNPRNMIWSKILFEVVIRFQWSFMSPGYTFCCIHINKFSRFFKNSVLSPPLYSSKLTNISNNFSTFSKVLYFLILKNN